MKKTYFKTKEGVLRTPTEEELKAGVDLVEIETQDPVDPPNSMKELEGVIRDLAKGVKDIKDTQELHKAELEAYKKAVASRFPLGSDPMPPADAPDRRGFENVYEANAKMAGMTVKEAQEFFGEYDLAIQGRMLQDKLSHPLHVIDEATRLEMAKFYLLMLRASWDPRAKEKFIDTYGGISKTAIGDVGNVFPLPRPLEAEILAFARESSVLLQFCRVWPMTSEKMGVPAESASVTVAWGNTTPSSDPGITEVSLEAWELSAYSTVKNATLADTASDIVGWINQNMAEAAGLELDNQGFNGTGTPFFGLLTTTGAGYSVVTTGTSYTTLSADDLSSMIAKLDGAKKQGARFFMHGQLIHRIRVLKDSQNRPIFLDGSIAGGTPPTIYGYPYSEVIKCPSTDASNTAFMVFGNPRYYSIGRRLDVATLTVNPYIYWTTNRTSFKLYQRWAMVPGLKNGFCRLLTKT